MQLSRLFLLLLPGISIAEGLSPSANQEGFLKLEKRKGCSGNRLNTDECQGNRIRAFNSFHNCQSAGGHCCAREKTREYGLDVRKGIGREDCGYCYTGYCKSV
ncbi:hypothetical protein CEP51_004989 [Fusarium floridanum]|uniref:Uncharacterized protein n=1 Tax=Fusarium floridanum TaxID=1325733 RepID=A0A428RYS9_9HYPO|nr:hypothetical protein CEP51_004989 [Fusarium floridanum]